MFTNNQELPKISIVTPSFNQDLFLEECISSVLDQNYPNLEYLIIDGGSTDQSVQIISKYEKRLTYWVSEPDEGQTDAINKGFQRTRGDIVAWLNADDFYLPGALTVVAEAYQRNSRASFYFGDGLRVDEKGQPKSGYFPDGQVLFNQVALILGLNYILQPAAFINQAHLVKIGYLDPALRYGMDTDLWIRLSQLAPPQPIQTRLAASREYDTTKTATGSFERIDELRKIAKKHSGLSFTPGVLCYFLDTLHRFVGQKPDVFPPAFDQDLKVFWASAANLMRQYGAGPDGFPLSDNHLSSSPSKSRPAQSYRSIVGKLTRKLRHRL